MDTAKNWNIFKNLVLYTFVVLVGLFLYKIQDILILFFAAFIVASAIDPLVEFLSKKIPRKISLLIVLVLLLAVVLGILVPFLSIFLKRVLLFLNKLPAYWETIRVYLEVAYSKFELMGVKGAVKSLGLSKWIEPFQTMGVLPDLSQVMSFASSLGQSIVAGSIGLTAGFLSAVAFFIAMTIITVYMLMDKVYLKEKLLSLFPQEFREKTANIMGIISHKVGGYVVSQIVIVLTLGLLLTLGFAWLGIEFSLVLAWLAAIMELIPVVGPLIAGITIVLVAFAQKPILALWAILVYWVVEWVVDTFVRPIVFGKFLNIHPLTLIFSFFVGVMLFGIPGLILAPAAAAVVSVLVDELYIKRINPEQRSMKRGYERIRLKQNHRKIKTRPGQN